jgi:amidase
VEIPFATTTELAQTIQKRDLSASQVLEAHLEQIACHNPALNAVVILDEEQARRRAREADEALARGAVWGPLHGVPFILKDAHCTQGVRTTVGFPPFAEYVPHEDGAVAARLKAAGAILMGKSNVHEMLGDPLQSINPLFGRTNNPWNRQCVPGGSSGGAAAAVAAGMTPFDIGTDLAGSLRIPAHMCGIFGFKPTEHRVPMTGLVPNPQGLPRAIRVMSSIGPMARSVDDLVLLFQVLAGPDGSDTDVPPVAFEPLRTVQLQELRVAVAPTFAWLPVASEIRTAIDDLAAQLASLCAKVEVIPNPPVDVGHDLESAGALLGMMIGALQPQVQDAPVPFAQYLGALHQRDQSIHAWEAFFGEWDVLLCPPSMMSAFPHCEPGTPLAVDGEPASYWLGNAHSILFNYTGHPAVVLPFRQDVDGMPIGVQLVGKRWDDSRLLAIAKAISALTGDFQRPPLF